LDTSIHPLKLGIANCFVLKGKEAIMVDGGAEKNRKKVQKAMGRLPIPPEEIKLIIITHGHYDHISSLKPLQEITGAKIAMHHQEKESLENTSPTFPKGVGIWGKTLSLMFPLMKPFTRTLPLQVDLVLDDKELSLKDYGVPGRIVFTPGHTMGSVSVLLDTGDAFVGDLAMNGFPMRIGPGLPIFAHDIEKVKESLKRLLEFGAKTIYPSHGKPFPVKRIQKALK
jgi:glyoxylase-like metal-dependent hydrolase (beta-lactamase superfamily II)